MNFSTLKNDDAYLRLVGEDVWLMDNHKWALSVWAHQHAGHRRRLIHADHHWDGVDLFHENQEAIDALISEDLEGLDRRIRDEDRIQYDAFIAPAVRLGLLREVHFFCTQRDDWDKGIHPTLCEPLGVTQFIYDDPLSIAELAPADETIFDLCLDLFNEAADFYGSDLWSDDRIHAFLESAKPLIVAADVVTVSMSFGYSGAEEDTRRLTAMVVPLLLAWRSSPHGGR